MKIIGWDRKGNVVRFALGKDDLDYWSGDDWNDTPYEHNASTTPLFGVEYYVDVAFRYIYSLTVFIPYLIQSTTISSAFSTLTPCSFDILSAKNLLIATSNVIRLSVLPVTFTFAFSPFKVASIIFKISFSFIF